MNNKQGQVKEKAVLNRNLASRQEEVYWSKRSTLKEDRDLTPRTLRIYDADLSDRHTKDAS